jgi:thiamine pyrophosphate-dependent acetolactate synthase large subunit-like protein
MAASLGGKGVRVATRSELASALEAAHADETAFHLIEIIIPRDAISRTLERFVGAIRQKSALGKDG